MFIGTEECLTIPKAAEKIAQDLQLSPYTVSAYLRMAIAADKLKAYKRGDKSRQYLKISDIEEYKRHQLAYIPVKVSESR